MARPGPAPQPIELKMLHGNPGKRPLNAHAPKPRPEVPRCPSWLLPEAKREWRRVAPQLDRLGLLALVDRAALAGYCQAYARWVEAELILAVAEPFIPGHRGVLVKHPAHQVARDTLTLVKAFCAEFGMTPSARGRMTVPDVQEDGNWPFDV